MQVEKIKTLIESGLPGAKVDVDGDGVHFEALVVYDGFEGVSRIKRQQMVYQTVREEVQSGELHALSMKTMTPEEWQSKHG